MSNGVEPKGPYVYQPKGVTEQSWADTAALRALLAKATPGEWRVRSDDDECCVYTRDKHPGQEDAELIAAAHNALPALLDEAARWRQVVAMREEIEYIKGQHERNCIAEDCDDCPQSVTLDALLALIGDGYE